MKQEKKACRDCGKMTVCVHFSLNVPMCQPCQRNYPLISKGKAKSVFKLTDKLLDTLPFIKMKNPVYATASPMILFLRSDVEKLANATLTPDDDLELVECARQLREENPRPSKLSPLFKHGCRGMLRRAY